MGKINLKAIALGCLTDWAGTALFGLLFGIIAVSTEIGRGMSIEQAVNFLQQWSLTPAGMRFSLLFGLGFTGLGGYVAARTSPQKTLINSAVVGCLGIIAGLPFVSNTPIAGILVSLALSIPAAMAGGLFYTKK
jgi:hypothetical protein